MPSADDPLANDALEFCGRMRDRGVPAFVIYMDEDGNPRMACLKYPYAVVKFLLLAALRSYRRQVPSGAHN